MQKTTKILILLIFIEILFISIGYAAISSIGLNISGFVQTTQLISPDIPQSVFYYAGYRKNNGKVTDLWTPGDQAKDGLVLHYDGIYNYLNESTKTIENIVTTKDFPYWHDLSGFKNHGEIRVGSETMSYDQKVDDCQPLEGTAQWHYTSTNPKIRKTYRDFGSYDWQSSYLQLKSNSFVINEKPNSLPILDDEYTIEIVFDYTGPSTDEGDGLVGMGIYASATVASNYGQRIKRLHEGAKVWHIINYSFFENYRFYPYHHYPTYNKSAGDESRDKKNNDPSTWDPYPENFGKANAVRISSNGGTGIKNYYWGDANDFEKNDILTTSKPYTVTVLNKNNKKYIYVDGGPSVGGSLSVDPKTSTPKTSFTEDYNWNRNGDNEGDGVKNGTPETRTDAQVREETSQPVTVGATRLNVDTSFVDRDNGDFCCWAGGGWNKNHCYATVIHTLEYKEFFSGKIYAVRIYNRALTEDEIKLNSSIDKRRFNFK